MPAAIVRADFHPRWSSSLASPSSSPRFAGRSARACARHPSDSPRCRRRCAPHGGRGIASATGFALQAEATARTAAGSPIAFGDLGIARRRAGRDRPQRLPDALLERRAGKCRAASSRPRAGASTKPITFATIASKPASSPTISAFGKRSCRSRASASGSSPIRIAQTPFCGGRDEDRAERALGHGEADRRADAAVAVGGRRHAEPRVRRLVEARGSVEAGVVEGACVTVSADRAGSPRDAAGPVLRWHRRAALRPVVALNTRWK